MDHALNKISPVFAAAFAFLLFREIQFNINASVLLGGLPVFAGAATIIWNNS